MIKIGTYNERILIQRSVTTPNGSGGFYNTWQDVRETWAKVTPVNGTRNLTAGEQVLEDGLIIHIRRNTEHSLAKNYQIIWRGDAYQIQSIIEKNADHWIWEIICKRQGDGFMGLLGTPVPESIIETPDDQNIQVP